MIPWPPQCSPFWPPLIWTGFDSWISISPAPRGLVQNQLEISLAEHPFPWTSEKVITCRTGASWPCDYSLTHFQTMLTGKQLSLTACLGGQEGEVAPAEGSVFSYLQHRCLPASGVSACCVTLPSQLPSNSWNGGAGKGELTGLPFCSPLRVGINELQLMAAGT